MIRFTALAIIATGLFACQPKYETINNYSDDFRQTQNDPTKSEGTINGGGGKGIRCVDPVTGRSKVEVLDVYESKVLYGLESLQSPTDEDGAMQLFAEKLARHFWNPFTIPVEETIASFKDGYRRFFGNEIRFIAPGKRLKLINDSFEPLVDANCEMVQIAVYYDESILLIDKDLWDQLDWLNRVALYAHEIFYKMDRRNGNTNSMTARKLVGQMFSTKGARTLSDGAPTDDSEYATCHIFGGSNFNKSIGYFYAWNSKMTIWDQEKKGLEAIFTYLENKSPLFRTSIFLEDLSLETIFSDQNPTPIQPIDGSSSPLLVESYTGLDFKEKELYFKWIGSGQGTLSILDLKTNQSSTTFDVRCQAPRNP